MNITILISGMCSELVLRCCEALSAPGLVLLQVWSQKSVFFILVCSAATRDFLLTFGVLYANKIPTNRLWTIDGSLDIDLRWSYSRPRSGTIQLCVLLSRSVCHAQQDTCCGLMISQDLSRVTASYLYPQTPWICLLSTPSLGELVLSKSLLLSQQSGLYYTTYTSPRGGTLFDAKYSCLAIGNLFIHCKLNVFAGALHVSKSLIWPFSSAGSLPRALPMEYLAQPLA